MNIYNRPYDKQSEPQDYLAFQEQLFQGMTIDDIYEYAKAYADKKQPLSQSSTG